MTGGFVRPLVTGLWSPVTSRMLFPKFQKFLRDHGLLQDGGDPFVVAVSGGVDSMVLLDCFARLSRERSLRLIAAHVNHRLRGRASDADESLVRRTCEARGIECAVARRKPPRRGANLQDAARRIRYAFFEEVARGHGAGAIATAHHADDQAETLLLHLLRGSGLAGLAGIRPVSMRGNLLLLRPLLAVTRREIEAYARRRRIAYRHDASNASAAYARNRLRHRLLPELRRFNPRIAEALAGAAERLRADDEALEVVAREALAGARAGETSEGVALSRTSYLALPRGIRTRLLVLAFAEASGGRSDLKADQLRRMDEIASAAKPAGEYRLPAPWRFSRRGDLLIITRCRHPRSSGVASRGNRETIFRCP